MISRFLKVAAFLGIAVVIFSEAAGKPGLAADAVPKPNIVIIIADDQGYEDAGFMGSKQIRTPNLDKLARGGTILKSFYAQPVCSPTRAALMSGRYAVHTGVYTIVTPLAKWGLPLEERTLADALRSSGYETAIVGKWHLGEFQAAYRPTHRGFDHQYGLWFGAIDYFTHMRNGILDWHRDDQPCKDEGYSTHLIAKEACRLIREKAANKPLFLYVPFNAVHAPYEAPKQHVEPFTNLTGVRRTYAGMMAALDEGAGQILAALREKKILDNTLIVFSSDNGGPSPDRITSNRPLRAGKGTIYEGGIRVCAFANWPGHIPAGKICDEPLHIVDWYPTLVKLSGGSLEQKLPLDGRDIWPVLTEAAKSPHRALFVPGMKPTEAVLRMGDWKLLHWAGKQELYNLAADIGEEHDLAGQQPARLKELRAELDKWLAAAVPPGNRAALDARAAEDKRRTSRGEQAQADAAASRSGPESFINDD
jgi:arylsulfatase A-like enzyme